MNRIFTLRSSLFVSLILLASTAMISCQESLEDRAVRESQEYTLKYCPSPPENGVITDSLVFDKKTKTQYYYITFTDQLDNEEKILTGKDIIIQGMLDLVRNDASRKIYRDAGFGVAYVIRSKSTGKILLDMKFSAKDLKN